MPTTSWPEQLIDEYAKRLRKDPLNVYASYFTDIANHISCFESQIGKRYCLGYISVVVRLVFCFRKMLDVDANRITTKPINAVWLSTPAHAETIEAFLGNRAISSTKITNKSKKINKFHGLFYVIYSLPKTIYIFSSLCLFAPRRIRNRIKLFEFILHVITYTRSSLLKSISIGPCVLSYELPALNKAIALLTRRAGQRVVHVMHGLKHPNFQVTAATDLVLLSNIDETWFRNRIDPCVRIWTIGHPRLEMIRSAVGLPAMCPAPRLPRIAFFSQPSEGDYSMEQRMLDWAILAGLRDRAELRIRLHPRETREKALLALSQAGLDFAYLSDAGLHHDLEWCDAIASSWSTVSMEAAACGRGIFWTCSTPERYLAAKELRAHGIGVLLQTATDWDSYLESWIKHGWHEPIIVSETRLRELGMIGDMNRPWLERLALVDPPASEDGGSIIPALI